MPRLPDLSIRPYHGIYGPRHAMFTDAQEQTCVITENVSHDDFQRLLLGVRGRLMVLKPQDARRLIAPLHHFATHGCLPDPVCLSSKDYEI